MPLSVAQIRYAASKVNGMLMEVSGKQPPLATSRLSITRFDKPVTGIKLPDNPVINHQHHVTGHEMVRT